MLIAPKIFVEYSSENKQTCKVELTELLTELLSIINQFRNNQVSNNSSDKNEPLLSLSQLAEKLNKSESTIHNWKRKKFIPFRRVGRSIFFKESEVVGALNKINEKKSLFS
jgi:hypothetical protein